MSSWRARRSLALFTVAFVLHLACGATREVDADGGNDADRVSDTGADGAGDAASVSTDADLPRDADRLFDGEPHDGDAASDGSTDADGVHATTGEILVLTYNVAGLPDWLSSSSPARNTPLVSPLLNGYDLVLVQEDFWYHPALAADATHPYRSDPMVDPPRLWRMGDGLNRFSVVPFSDHERVTWAACNGVVDDDNDCLTTKGFAAALTELALGAPACVYNLHMDAGGEPGDISARERQGAQLAEDIDRRCAGRAVVLAGDTNLRHSRPEDMVVLDTLMASAGLTDACRELSCGDDRIDRVLFRSSALVTIEPLSWTTPPEFVDGSGEPLSDHEPVAARLRWSLSSTDGD